MKDTLTLAYMQDLNIIKEDQDVEQNVDDLTEENTTTIEESEEETSINNTEECEESVDGEDDEGWNDEVTELCDELTYQFDGFAYELKNCVRGSFTDANTPDELANYLENLKSSIDSVINQLRDM